MCIMGNVGSSDFGTWSILDSKSQDVSASAAAILTIFFNSVSRESPNLWKCSTKLLEHSFKFFLFMSFESWILNFML